VLTISAETISEEYATLRKNYYSRILFGILTFFIGLILTNIGLVQNELPKGRIMIIFGGLLLILTVITSIIVIYTDRRLKHLNTEFVENCVKILEKEKIVTWTASFQHLLFDIIYPYNGRAGVGAVILTPNPYFAMLAKETTDNSKKEHIIKVNDDHSGGKNLNNIKLPIIWNIDESISEGPNEEAPLIKNDKIRPYKHQSLILPPSDNDDDHNHKFVISAAEHSESEDSQIEESKTESEHTSNDGDNEQIEIEQIPKIKKKTAPKAYTGFDDVSKENVQKIHGDLIQRFFHENPEDIEGHGEDTQLLQNNVPLEQPNHGNVAQN